ncbi:hypothetical protein DEDGFLLK_00090 [Lactiplantibacillus phage Gut-P1]|nr:hypothetical protein DEDGFLLK_00090 [Lactiplantibacillus phage Gut-P1]
MKRYLLVNEYELVNEYDGVDDSVVHKQYVVTEAENPTEAVLSDLRDDLFETNKGVYDNFVDSGLLKKSTVDIREMRGDETIGDNLIYDILKNS